MYSQLVEKILREITYNGIMRKQASIGRLFPTFPSRVRAVAAQGGVTLVEKMPDTWHFKVPSSKGDGVKYDVYVRFRNIEEMIKSKEEAVLLLKKCLANAEQLTGNHYFGTEPSRQRDLSVHSPIDQRRLFDSLRYENGALITIYSLKDHKIIFVNETCKTLLGWTPEKFSQDFSTILQVDLDWKQLMEQLSSTDSPKRLIMKTKDDHELMLNCLLGSPSSGLFKHYVIGVSYP